MSLKNVIISSFLCLLFSSFLLAQPEISSPKQKELLYAELGSYIKISVKKADYKSLYINSEKINMGWFAGASYKYLINHYGVHMVSVIAVNGNGEIVTQNVTFTVLKKFQDISNSSAKKEIELLVSYHLLPGWDYSYVFVKDRAVSRKELARFIASSLGLGNNKFKNTIADVLDTDPDVSYIMAVVKNKILSVNEDGNFFPNGIVRRADLVAAFQKAYGWKNNQADNYYFSDVNEKFWAKDAIYSAVCVGVIPDWWVLDNYFRPSEIVSRQDFAAVFARLPEVTEMLNSYLGEISFSSFSGKEKVVSGNSSDELIRQKFKISSENIVLDGKTVFSVLFNSNKGSYKARVRKVDFDLTSIGRAANTSMSDDGSWGDVYKNDGVYSLFFVADKHIATGNSTFDVTVTDIYNNTYLEQMDLNAVSPTENKQKKKKENVEIASLPSSNVMSTLNVLPEMETEVSVNHQVVVLEVADNVVVSYNQPVDLVYEVKAGDTMLKIARKLTGDPINWNEIALFNNMTVYLRDVNGEKYQYVNIFVGQKIIIPGKLIK